MVEVVQTPVQVVKVVKMTEVEGEEDMVQW